MVMFHHVFLTRDLDGPCVFVWGEKSSDAFHCEYVEKTEWKTLAEIEAEKKARHQQRMMLNSDQGENQCPPFTC